ncbi:MAG: Gldg family protein [Burkholderiales bacterium]
MRGFTGKRYIAAIAAAALALGAYILAYWLEDGYNLRLDATREQYTVLSEGTKQALGGLQKKVYVYYVEGEERDLTYALLKSYASASENLSVGTVGADSKEAAALGAAQRSVIVSDTDIMSASQSKRTAVLSASDLYQDSGRTGISPGVKYFRGEQRITSAIKYVAQEKAGRVVFLSGQGESKPCDRLIADIEDMYYGAGFITAEAPLDPASNILAVIGPKEDVSDAGYRNIKAFLDSGGRAVFFMDSMSADEETGETEYLGDRLNNFKALISGYGISIGSNVIIGGNPAQTYKSPVNVMPAVTEEGAEALYISGKPLRPVLSYAGVIELSQAEGVQTVPLLSTDISCRAVNAREPLNLGGESGTAGSFIAGALAKKDETSIVVFSSSSFITSSADYSYKGNSDLFLNTIKFLGSSQGPVYIPAKKLYDEADAAYRLSLNQDMKPLLMAAAAGVPALAVFLCGLSRWAKRRRL